MVGFDRNVGVKTLRLDSVEEIQVLGHRPFGLGPVPNLLAEDVNSAHCALRVHFAKGADRIVDALPGHIAARNPADDRLWNPWHSVFDQGVEKAHEILLESGACARMAQYTVSAPAPRSASLARLMVDPGGGDVVYQEDGQTACAARGGEAPTGKLEAAGARIPRLPVKPVTSQQRHHRFIEMASNRGCQQVRRRPGAANTTEGMGGHRADGVD